MIAVNIICYHIEYYRWQQSRWFGHILLNTKSILNPKASNSPIRAHLLIYAHLSKL